VLLINNFDVEGEASDQHDNPPSDYEIFRPFVPFKGKAGPHQEAIRHVRVAGRGELQCTSTTGLCLLLLSPSIRRDSRRSGRRGGVGLAGQALCERGRFIARQLDREPGGRLRAQRGLRRMEHGRSVGRTQKGGAMLLHFYVYILFCFVALTDCFAVYPRSQAIRSAR